LQSPEDSIRHKLRNDEQSCQKIVNKFHPPNAACHSTSPPLRFRSRPSGTRFDKPISGGQSRLGVGCGDFVNNTRSGAKQSKAVAKKLPFHRAVLEAALYIEIGRSRLRDDFPVANSSPRLWLFAASTYAFCNSTSKHGVHSPPVSPPSPCGK
jgi:hypothetical protein